MSSDIGLDGLRTTFGAPEPPAPSLAEGDRFADRYVVARRLGAGGMGVVYLASDELTREDVALKLIHPSLLDTDARQRMIDEGVLARKVSHPNVVRVHDVGVRDGQVYLVMEYVKGRSLRAYMTEHIASGSPVPLPAIEAIIRSMLAGIGAAHARGLVHRDVKPENIIIEGEPGAPDFRLKILDFGIARGLKTEVLTGSRPMGTPLYMAPEQKTAPQAVGPAADIYSVGRILYELLVEMLPEGPWNPPSEQRADVPAALDAVIRKSQQAPRGRYQDVDAFQAAFEEALHGASNRVGPAPQPPPAVSGATTPAAGGDWRSTMRQIEDFDRRVNPMHGVYRKLGFKEQKRLSEMPANQVVRTIAIGTLVVAAVMYVLAEAGML